MHIGDILLIIGTLTIILTTFFINIAIGSYLSGVFFVLIGILLTHEKAKKPKE